MRAPERCVGRQGETIPGEVLRAGMQHAVVVPVDPEREAAGMELRQTAGGVGRAGVGGVDHPSAPGGTGGAALSRPARPAALGDDLAERLAELAQAGAGADRAVDGAGQVGQQVGLGRARDHERAVVLRFPQVCPDRRRH